MLRRTLWGLTLLFCMAAFCGSLLAQTDNTITIRILDGKTGKPIFASGFLVRVDHEQTVHANWVVPGQDGTATLTVPASATLISIQGTYEESTQIYVNCDSINGKESPIDRWYAISDILTSGIVAPNGCGKPKDAAKIKLTAKPGEFVFLVRRMSMMEQWKN